MNSGTVTVNCLVKNGPWEKDFEIKIHKDQTIGMLKQEIKQVIAIDAQYKDFILYGVLLSKHDEPRLSEIYGQPEDQQDSILDPMHTVEEALLTRKEKHIYVIVKLPSKRQLLTDTDYPSKVLRLEKPTNYLAYVYSCWRWWQSVRKMKIEKAMTFSTAILGSKQYGSMIFVRDAYEQLFDKIIWNKKISNEDEQLSDEVTQDKIMGELDRDSYIITGTPGIGKTFFGFYLICRYVEEYPDFCIIWQDANLMVVLRPNGGITCRLVVDQSITSIGPSGEVSNREDIPLNKETLYIVDAVKPAWGPHVQFVLLTSPIHEPFKGLEKRSSVHKLGMPVWSKTELEQLWKLKFSSSIEESAWKDRFDKWGGVPRSVLDKPDDWYQQELKNSIRQLRKLDLEACIYSVAYLDYNSDPVSGTIVHTIVSREDGYEKFHIAFASLYIENKVMSRYKQWIKQEMIKLTQIDSSFASVRGCLFAVMAHNRLTMGGNFVVRRLGDPESKDVQVMFPSMESRMFASLDEVTPDYYYRPSNTFQSIDALRISSQGLQAQEKCGHDELFQMTVSKEHGIRVNGLEKIKPKLTINGAKRVRLYFVVPNDIYPSFTGLQNYLTKEGRQHRVVPKWIEDNVEQWALMLDYASL